MQVRTLLIRLQKAHGGGEAARSLLVEPIVRVEFRGLGMALRGKAGRTVLDGVTGLYEPGQLHAVMGPSGSGAPPAALLALCQLAYVCGHKFKLSELQL
jgi:ABC-type multidrug transport system fused ATPase/permease subunit